MDLALQATADGDLAEPFSRKLFAWYEQAARRMPWRESSDPYLIWVSEVMLQQTRVDQAMPYFERFVGAFPTIHSLAEADLDEVLLKWEGLGYYARARNLHRAARLVVAEHGGSLPPSADALARLPGIGSYTSAAIASIAFGERSAAVDGNVTRVLARIFAIDQEVTAPATRRTIQGIADEMVSRDAPGRFNQALMELGSTVCRPSNPDCAVCPVTVYCSAYHQKRQRELPVKASRPSVPHQDIAVGIVEAADGSVLITRRAENGLLGGLWEFPGGKRELQESLEETCRRELLEEVGIAIEVLEPCLNLKHAYSHFKITLHAFWCRIVSGSVRPPDGRDFQWVPISKLDTFAFPRANRRLIQYIQSTRP